MRFYGSLVTKWTSKEFITVDDEQVRLKSIDYDQYNFCITRK